MREPTPEFIAAVEKKLIDEGLLIEAGWQGLRLAAIPVDAPLIQLEEMRNAFFAGAQHLYVTLLRVMEDGDEATATDLARMGKIDDELHRFYDEFTARHGMTRA
jgi:hypothetical protein